VRNIAAALILLAVSAGAARAQLPNLPTFGPSWTDVSYPKIYYSNRDGFALGLYYAQIKQLGYDDWDAPPAYASKLSFDFFFGTSGSKQFNLEWRSPMLADGWRFVTQFQWVRRGRENYFGLGNDAPYDEANVTDQNPDYYRSNNRRAFAYGEVQRRIIGPLRALVGFNVEEWHIDTLPGESQLALDRQAGLDPTIGVPTADMAARVGLVLDMRDDEIAPRRGLVLEAILAGADSTIAGDLSYTRLVLSAKGYVPIGPKLVIAGRIAAQAMSGSPRLGDYYRFERSERPFGAFGGSWSHRGLWRYRFLDSSKLIGNLDLRYDLLAQPTLYRLTLLGFLDAGRVFPTDDFRLTTEDLKVGGGLGLMAQFFRAAIVGFTVGAGPDKSLLALFYTAWTY
jgi:outer membrane protein assembly factor BamA